MNFCIWIYDGSRPELLARANTLVAARASWRNSKHAVIVRDGEVVDTKPGADASRLTEIRDAITGASKGAAPAKVTPRALPVAAVMEPMPAKPVCVDPDDAAPVASPIEPAPLGDAPSPPSNPATPAKASPTAASRALLARLARRRTPAIADGTPTSKPVVEPTPLVTEAVPVEVPAPLGPVLTETFTPTADLARIQRLLNGITIERDGHRDRADGAEHLAERLRGEVEGLTTELRVARRDASTSATRAHEMHDERDEVRTMLATSLSTGLATAEHLQALVAKWEREAIDNGDQLLVVEAERDQLLYARAQEHNDRTAELGAATRALDEIVALCGGSTWADPALVVRDVQQLRAEWDTVHDEIVAERDASRADARLSATAAVDLARELGHVTAAALIDRDDAAALALDALREGLAECEALRRQIATLEGDLLEEVQRADHHHEVCKQLRAAPALLDGPQLARIIDRAVRQAVVATRDDMELRAIADSVGGVGNVRTIVAAAVRMFGAVQR